VAARLRPHNTPVAAAGPASEVELEFWRSIKDSNKPEELNAYLTNYPNGTFKPIALARIASVQDGPSTVTRNLTTGAGVDTLDLLGRRQSDHRGPAQPSIAASAATWQRRLTSPPASTPRFRQVRRQHPRRDHPLAGTPAAIRRAATSTRCSTRRCSPKSWRPAWPPLPATTPQTSWRASPAVTAVAEAAAVIITAGGGGGPSAFFASMIGRTSAAEQKP